MKLVKGVQLAVLLCCLVLPLASQAATHVVQQVGFTFSPKEITIAVGDSIRWEWNDSIHTVTSGTGPTDPSVGSLFDAPLDSADPVFIFRFMQQGDVPYFCRVHFSLGMTGTVHVTPATSVEAATWGAVKSLY